MSGKYGNVEKVSVLDDIPVAKKPADNKAVPNAMSSIKKVIGVISGKGGVGKSLVTSLCASEMQRKGYKTGILDADITGPSIPQYFGLTGKTTANQYGMLPMRSETGIDIMSINILLDDVKQPVVWRGPIVASTVTQFWTDVVWENIDYLFIDMPPGTGDVALTTFQKLPVDGIIIVTSPQELVSLIVSKAVNMAKELSVPVIGIVENMAYFECDDCGKKHEIYGPSTTSKVSEEFGLPIIASIPIESQMARLADSGKIENYSSKWLTDLGAILGDMSAM